MELKELKGIINYNPIAYAVGSRKTAKLRPYIPILYNLLEESYSTSYIQYIKRQLKKDNNLLTRIGPNACHPIIINKIYNEALTIETESIRLKLLLKRIKKELIITKIKENWAIVVVPLETIKEAREELFHKKGQKPAISCWGPHVTFIRQEVHREPLLKDGKEITLYYNTKIHEGKNNYFFHDVLSPELETLRISQGLSPNPNPDFHLTIGQITKG
jgi:hypothetical protein